MKNFSRHNAGFLASSGYFNLGIQTLFFISLTVIAFITLFPFHFEQFDRIFRLSHYFEGFYFREYHHCCTHLTILEPLANVLLFVPFGFGLVGMIRSKYSSLISIFLIGLFVCIGFSLTIEILQIFQPRRTSSLTDLAMNTLGGAGGLTLFFLVRAVRNRFRHPLSKRLF